ncbi:MAG: type II toxin-antitoxin system VapC family toxin [Halobacteria archaeon]|nr:type II toxin-antitoxin system VapC family toxin [Halobacteria archaeon]
MNELSDTVESVLLDVNSLAIGLTDNHPAHEYIHPVLEDGVNGDIDLLIFSYLPLRAQYIMVSSFEVNRIDARNAVQSFLRSPVDIVSASKETLLSSYEISAEKNHDVYDCFFVALARQHRTEAILTTDTDFKKLCDDEEFLYVNPVPESVLEELGEVSG